VSKYRFLAITGLLTLALASLSIVAAMAAGSTTGELSADRAELQETSFGDLVTDALCDKANTAIAFVGAVSFKRGTIPPGPMSVEQVAALLQTPDETWAVAELSGAQIRQALERSVSRCPLPNGAFLQVSGLSFTYTPRAGANGRVKSILIGAAPISEGRKYEVVMPLSLAKGGSGYFQVFDESAIKVRGTGAISQAVVDFVAAHGSVSYTGQGRIQER
jgi:5'-nucleotidase / UDP-sugar diphosphatase